MAEAERITGTTGAPVPRAAADEEAGAAPDGKAPREPRDGGAPEETESGAAAPDAAPASVDRRRITILLAVAAVAYALDLISKTIVVAKLEHHPAIDLIGDWLRLDAIRNPGAAFGMGGAFTVLFTVIAAAVIFVIVRLARKLRSLPWAVALGLLLGGALGNLTDRLFRSPHAFEGAVVDFIAPKYFAVFNLADSAIVCGGILIVLLSFRGLDPDGTVHRD